MKKLIFIMIWGIGTFANAQVQNDIFSSVVGPNNEPVIFNAINMNSYDLVSSNIQFSEENNLQKLVISPFKLIDDTPPQLIRNSKFNITQKNGISTFGVSLGMDNSSAFSKRGDELWKKIIFPAQRSKKDDESEQEYEVYKAKSNFSRDSLLTDYHEKLIKNSFQLTLAMNTSFFSVIGGDKVDLDNDGLIDNENSVESYNYSLSMAFAFNEKRALSLSVHNIRQLAEPTEGQERVNFWGFSFSFASRIKILNNNYEYTDDYKKSLFIPAIFAGFTVEFLEAQNNLAFVKDDITEKLVFTPYFDFKINAKNQFRIGVPIQKFESMTTEVALGPFVQWGFTLSNLN